MRRHTTAGYDSRGVAPRLPTFALFALVTASTACATLAREPWVLDSASMRTEPVARAAWVATWPQALASVLDVFQREWRFPRLDVRLVFLPDDATFERLLLEIGYSPELARNSVATMRAIGGHRRVLINESRLDDDEWPARVGLLAHELTHVLQYELGGGTRGQSDQWLREGFADWIETGVLARLGAVDAAQLRTDVRRRLRSTRADRYPPLLELATFPNWVTENRRRPGADLYAEAAVAVTILVERHGIERVLDYFGRFAARQARAANFQEAFGESLEAFDRAFRTEVWGNPEG